MEVLQACAVRRGAVLPETISFALVCLSLNRSSARVFPNVSITYLRYHYPNRAAAAAAAIEGAAAADTPPDPAPPGVEDKDSFAEFIVDVSWEEAGLVNASEAATMLGVNRKTVYRWIDKGRLLGWQTSRQRYAIPKEQIIGAERIVKGIPQLLEIIGDPELVWAFLSSAWPFEDDVARPIDKLRSGDVEAVLGAAPAYGFTPR